MNLREALAHGLETRNFILRFQIPSDTTDALWFQTYAEPLSEESTKVEIVGLYENNQTRYSWVSLDTEITIMTPDCVPVAEKPKTRKRKKNVVIEQDPELVSGPEA